MFKTLLSLFFAVFSLNCFAQDKTAYVVKVDSGTIYIDITQTEPPPFPGQEFSSYREGEELVNPVTKASLGRIRITTSSGTVTEIQKTYASGQIRPGGNPKPGERVAFSDPLPPGPAPEPAKPLSGRSTPLWQSGPIDISPIDIAVADVDGDKVPDLIAVSDSQLSVLSRDGNNFKIKYPYMIPPINRILSVEAADLKNIGRAQIFVSVYNSFLKTMHTLVFELADGKLTKMDTLKWIIRAADAPDGKRHLYGQTVFSLSPVKAGPVEEITWSEARYLGTPAKDIKLDWLYSFAYLDVNSDGMFELAYITDARKMKVQFIDSQKSWTSEEEFGRTPNRLALKTETLYLYPRVLGRKMPDGTVRLYGIRNIPKEGLLSEAQGQYKDAVLQAMTWRANTMEYTWETAAGGSVGDITYGKLADLPEGIILPVTAQDGKTYIKIYGY